MASVGEVQTALSARKDYIKANIETLTAKQTRRLLAKDLGLGQDGLDHHKQAIKTMLEEVLQEMIHADQQQAAEPDGDAKAGKKRRRAKDGEEGSKQKKASAPAPAAADSKADAKVQRLKKVCQQAGIAVGPSIYKREDRVRAFEELLDKHDLHGKSSAEDIARVKEALERAKDLEGIDAGNIVEGGRRRRPAPPKVPAALVPAPAKEHKAKGGAAKSTSAAAGGEVDEDDSDDDFGQASSSEEGESGGSSDEEGTGAPATDDDASDE